MTIKDYAHHREVSRDAILFCIKELTDKNIPYKQIASSLLEISLEIVSNEHFEITYPSDLLECSEVKSRTAEVDDTTDNEDEDEDGYEDDYWKESRKFHSFQKTITHVSFEKLRHEAWKFREMQDYAKQLNSEMNILKLIPKHIAEFIDCMGVSYADKYQAGYLPEIEKIFKSYAVLQDSAKMEIAYDISKRISELLPEELFELDVLESKYKSALELARTFGAVKEFITKNPGIKQQEVYKHLSLDGRKLNNAFAIAERLNVVIRKRSGDSWLLSVI